MQDVPETPRVETAAAERAVVPYGDPPELRTIVIWVLVIAVGVLGWFVYDQHQRLCALEASRASSNAAGLRCGGIRSYEADEGTQLRELRDRVEELERKVRSMR